ncbi:MerR family transcriptional regulator [Paracoccus onubensis]|uniref:MerR family transcriptional regulator n=1 Tax=Paracoccus onubensis TaxID=1675788 RepID=UPI0027307C88|nr:MerR family transcriptional regulator [Paracoccus onubensis]MDP0927298.1 MerR family transcriptional regulator [Paracoccus onubensis]
MKKRADAFRSIGEVAKMIGAAPHVLRYWETQFSQLKPMKRPDGRRYYRPEDVQLAAGLCEVLREEGLTIRGAKKLIARDRGEFVRARGLARLNGESAELAQAIGMPSDIPAESSSATRPAPSQPDPAITEETPNMARSEKPRAPRSVARKPAQSLPLFPDLATSPNKRHGAWLSHLVSTAIRLRRAEGLDAASRRQCKILRDAITRHY